VFFNPQVARQGREWGSSPVYTSKKGGGEEVSTSVRKTGVGLPLGSDGEILRPAGDGLEREIGQGGGRKGSAWIAV